MKTAEEIYESVMNDNLTVHATIVIAINEARKEAIKECAEKAKCETTFLQIPEINICNHRVDKSSILSLIGGLK